MLGAIAGDIIGSRFETFKVEVIDPAFNFFTRQNRFTDDTTLTVAIAEALLTDRDYEKALRKYYRRYPYAGYGKAFRQWASVEFSPAYNSFGNGSAMRVSPVAYAFDTIEDVLNEAKKSAECSHNHPQGIKGAQAVALAIFLARKGQTKDVIKEAIERRFDYVLNDILTAHHLGFSSSCEVTVPQAITAFLESTSFEDSMIRSVAIGGDVDTIACMAGSISEAFYGLPDRIHNSMYRYLPTEMTEVIVEFEKKFINPNYRQPNVIISIQAQISDIFRSIFSP